MPPPAAVPPRGDSAVVRAADDRDADIATPDHLPSRSPSLAKALVAAGFVPDLTGDRKLPVSKYYPVDENGLYIEFIAQLQGGDYTRRGEPNDLLAVSGITAQKLRHVDLLLFEPWELDLSNQDGFDRSAAPTILVANPASYLLQKVLSLPKRSSSGKRAKDALYIHDTLAMFGSSFEALRDQAGRVLDRLAPKTRRDFHAQRIALFQSKTLTIDSERIAAATGRANPPSAGTIAEVCTVGLEQIFAPR